MVPPVVLFMPDYLRRAKLLFEDDKKYIQDRVAVKGGSFTEERSTKAELLATSYNVQSLHVDALSGLR